MGEKFEIGKVEVLLGWKCNNNCIFCSVGHKFPENKVKPWSEVKKHIDYAKEVNAGTFSFSGGEPTIFSCLIKGIKYAKSIGIKTIEVQSNGRMFSYMDFAKKVVDAGASRFLVSLHGDNAELVDRMNRVAGSFDQTVRGLKNLKELGIENLRFSTVISRFNYDVLPRIMRFLLKFGPMGIHVGYVIVDGNAFKYLKTVMPPRMCEVAPYIKDAIRVVKGAGTEVWVYSLPYCLLQGYEDVVAEMGNMDSILIGPDMNISLQEHRHRDRIKSDSCNSCKYFKLCLGPWKRYVKVYGFEEFKPVPGETITDPGEFMRQGYKS